MQQKSWMQTRQDQLISSTISTGVLKTVSSILSIHIGILTAIFLPLQARAAQTIHIAIGPIERTLSIESLETFVEQGELSGDLRRIAQTVDQEQLELFRIFLQRPIEMDAVTASQLTYTPIGEDFLKRLGSVIQTEAGQNGFYAIRASVILAADAPEGLSLLNILRYFPTDGIRIDIDKVLSLAQEFSSLTRYKNVVLEAIAHQAEQEILATDSFDFTQHSDLQQPGQYSFEKQVLILSDLTRSGQTNPNERQFEVDLYIPQGISQPAPVIAISHGVGAQRSEFAFLAEHLASHGFAVAVPEHIGSNARLGELIRNGNLLSKPDAIEFVDRPRDVSFVLDELERLSRTEPKFQGRMSLDRVGIIGHSLGGYTALAIASGQINHEQLNTTCVDGEPVINLSLILQCQAIDVPESTENFRDPRVVAVMALNPISSIILGQEGLSQIEQPVMLLQASQDMLAPMVSEQFYPFNWLTTSQRYLVTTIPGGHGSANQTELFEEDLSSSLLTGPNTNLGSFYTKALSVAFMQLHVNNQLDYEPYLSSAYAAYISQEPLQINLITTPVTVQAEQSK